MKLKFLKFVPVAALLCIVFASCKKNEAVTSVHSQQGSQLAKATSMIGAMENESDLEFSDALVASDRVGSSDCPQVSYIPSKDVYPHTKIVDFGTGCTDDNGITRSGKRFITVYADQQTAPAGKVVSAVTFSNYYINGINLAGNVKISVITPASSGNLTLRVGSDKTVSDQNGNTSSFTSKTIQKQIAGGGDDILSNDVFQISDVSYGTEIEGDSSMIVWHSATDASNPPIKQASCAFRSQGVLNLYLKQNGAETDEYLNYGNGDCDNMATLTINGVSQDITLPFYFFDPHL